MTKILAILFLFFSDVVEINSPKNDINNTYIVNKVIDGDTFYVINKNNKKEKIRLIGIDAPEIHPSQHKKVGKYGQEAKRFLTTLILNKQVKLEYDAGRRDQYGRTLAYIYLSNGEFVNAKLIALGYARAVTFRPNVKFSIYFMKLESQAKKKNLGLWRYE